MAASPPVTLTLEREHGRNFDDDAGRWVLEWGKVFYNGRHVANYARYVRQMIGSLHVTGMLTMTIFTLGGQPPDNVTLQGSYDFAVHKATGGVSAASRRWASYVGSHFTQSANTLEIS
jgi:hypothetical protein